MPGHIKPCMHFYILYYNDYKKYPFSYKSHPVYKPCMVPLLYSKTYDLAISELEISSLVTKQISNYQIYAQNCFCYGYQFLKDYSCEMIVTRAIK